MWNSIISCWGFLGKILNWLGNEYYTNNKLSKCFNVEDNIVLDKTILLCIVFVCVCIGYYLLSFKLSIIFINLNF